ncbi:MAG: DUF4097 family beta strand repeat-containing protein [Pseudomonadota bacterium]
MPQWIRAIAPVLGAATLMGAAAASAEFRLERELALPNDGRFELETDAGAIEIVGDRTQGVSVVVTADNAELEDFLAFYFESDDGLARVTAKRTERQARGGTFRGLKFSVRVPSAALVDARTSGGAVAVEQLGANAELRTSGGAVSVSGVAGDLLASTSGGPIAVDGVSGNVRVRTSGGALNLEALAGYVDAVTSGGSIQASFVPGNDRGGVLKTSGGRIAVALDPAANLSIDARTSAGQVRTSLPIAVSGKPRRSRLKGSLGDGGEALTLRSSGGSISLEAIAAVADGERSDTVAF